MHPDCSAGSDVTCSYCSNSAGTWWECTDGYRVQGDVLSDGEFVYRNPHAIHDVSCHCNPNPRVCASDAPKRDIRRASEAQ